MSPKGKRGGPQPGAGRPKGSTIDPLLKRRRLGGFRLPMWMIEWLNEQPESGGRLIEKALMKTYKLKKPKIKS